MSHENTFTMDELDDEYHSDTLWLSNSLLELWLRDRRDFEDYVYRKIRRAKITDEMKLGNFVESLVFRSPEYVLEHFITAPEHAEKPGKPIHRAGKAWEDFKARAGRRQILTPAHAELAHHMVDAIAAHPAAAPMLVKGVGLDQPSMRWRCPETGVLMRGKPERAIVEERCIIELKTDMDPRPTRDSLRRWDERGYYRKLAGYLDGAKAIWGGNWVGHIIYVANTPRPRVCVQCFREDSPVINIARNEYQRAALEIDECRAKGDFREAWETEAIEAQPVEWKLREWEREEKEELPPIKGARKVEVAHG